MNHLVKNKNDGGYVALISVIIIVALLMIITVAVSFSGFFGRFAVLDNEYKEVSVGLAEACGDAAILKLAENWDNPEIINPVMVDENTCEIKSISGSSPKLICTQANFRNSFTNLKIMVSNPAGEIKIDSWQEVPKDTDCHF